SAITRFLFHETGELWGTESQLPAIDFAIVLTDGRRPVTIGQRRSAEFRKRPRVQDAATQLPMLDPLPVPARLQLPAFDYLLNRLDRRHQKPAFQRELQ